MAAIRGLIGSMPVANSQLAQQQKAARDLQIQQAIKAQPVAAPVQQTAQTIGQAATQNAGQQAVQNAQAQNQQLTQAGQVAQQDQLNQIKGQINDLQAGQKDQAMQNVEKLAQISQDAKREMYDKRREFSTDEAGRKFSNERQLADYAALRAKNAEEFKDYVQQQELAYERKSQLLDTSLKKIQQQLQFENQALNQLRDQANNMAISERERESARRLLEEKLKQQELLRQAEADLQASLEKKAADKANRQAIYTGAGTIIGGTIGAAIGSPAGATVGASVGSGIGSIIGGAFG